MTEPTIAPAASVLLRGAALRRWPVALRARRALARADRAPRRAPRPRRLHRRRRQPGARHRRRGAAAHWRACAQDAARSKRSCRRRPVLRQQVLDALIDERVLVTNARDSGVKVDEAELDRAVANVALQNQMTMAQLRAAAAPARASTTRASATTCATRSLVERVREREVMARIRITDAEIDALLDQQRAAAGTSIATTTSRRSSSPCPRAPSEADGRRAPARAPRRRWRASRPASRSTAVAREMSEDGNRAKGGEIGMRPADRLPDLFVDAVRAAASRRGRADAAAQRRRLPRAQARRATRGRRLHDHADARAPHPAAPVGAARRRKPRCAAWPTSSARSSAGTKTLRGAGARELRGRQRRAGRRPRLGVARHLRARVRGGDEQAAARRHLRPGRLALRRAPDPGARAARRRRSTRSSSASRRATCCASRSSRTPTPSGCATCARGLHRDARAAAVSRRAGHEARRAQALRPALPDRRGGHRRDRRRDRAAARRRAGRDRPRPRRDDAARWSARCERADGDRARPRPRGAAAPPPRARRDRGRRAEGRFRRARARGCGAPLRVVGNLPYNISTPILFHLLGAVEHVARPALHAAEGSRRAHGRRARAARTTAG